MSCVLVPGPNVSSALYVAKNLRERDKKEIFACRWHDDPKDLALDVQGYGDFQWTAFVDKTPVALVGATPVWPNVWSVWAFGTDNWPKVVLSLTKHIKRSIIPTLLEHGVHRAECRALKEHEEACKWLEMLGAQKETELAGFGRQREDFILYVWRPEYVRRIT
jgi:hypothetical protein